MKFFDKSKISYDAEIKVGQLRKINYFTDETIVKVMGKETSFNDKCWNVTFIKKPKDVYNFSYYSNFHEDFFIKKI